MSKASEWAVSFSKRPRTFIQDQKFEATNNGELSSDSAIILSPKNALKLAEWIIETFGEPTKEEK